MFYTNLDYHECCVIYSVIGTRELNNRFGVLSKISRKTLNTLYITSHHKVF